MAKWWAINFYKSTAWLECREAYIKSKFGLCERCGDVGNIVHHKTYLNKQNIKDANITLNWDNLELTCQDCHNKEHHKSDRKAIRNDVMFDEFGQLISKSPP